MNKLNKNFKKIGYLRNIDGTVYDPPHLKEYDEYIKSLRDGCTGLDYRCCYCNKCPSGEHFHWPSNKRILDIQQNKLERRYFEMHNPSDRSLLDLEFDLVDEDDERDYERKHFVFACDIVNGTISFDLDLPVIFNDLFDLYIDPADASVEDLKNVVTVINYRTNLEDEYSYAHVDQYDNYQIIAGDFKPDTANMIKFVVELDYGKAKFRMADLFMEDVNFRFPKEATKFYVAVTMERMI